MSYCEIFPFKEGFPHQGGYPPKGVQFRNAWGGAARIWDALWDEYAKNPTDKYDSWIISVSRDGLWEISLRKEISEFKRSVHVFTFDRFYVKKENFKRFAEDLRTFDGTYPTAGISHLPAWAELIEKSEAEALALYATSVTHNPWFRYDGETGETTPIPLEDGNEIYEWLIQN
jgi:hypothetical protein